MNRAMIFPIHAKWTKKIFDGTKKFEFRNKLSKHLVPGMKIYFYETKGKIKKASGDLAIELRNKKGKGMKVINGYYYEGHGAIVGEVTVGEIYREDVLNHKRLITIHGMEDIILGRPLDEEDRIYITDKFKLQGYDNHKFAIKLTNVIKYDFNWMMMNLDTLLAGVSVVPIAKEEFISWNKVEKEVKRLIKLNPGWSKKELEEEILNNKIEGMDYKDYNYSITNVQNAPQAPIYIVERKVK